MNEKLLKLHSYLAQEELSLEADLLGDFLFKTSQETYTVKPNDTISGLAGGDPRYQQLILDANPEVVPERMRPGDKIVLPAKPVRPNQNMDYGHSLVEFIKIEEGIAGSNGEPALSAYDDNGLDNPGGSVTIGWGHRLGSVAEVNMNNIPDITVSQAEQFLSADMKIAANFVRNNTLVKLNQAQFDALTSLAFNAGAAAVYRSQLFKAINRGDFNSAIKLFSSTLVGDVKSRRETGGVQLRRNREAAMFTNGTGSY